MDDPIKQFMAHNEARAQECKEEIEYMMGQHDFYGYAETTLLGILEFIEDNNYITKGQILAIENIKDNPRRPYGLR